MIIGCNNEEIDTATRIISNGGIVVFPTDTVYGIGCNPYNQNAVKKIFKIKERDVTKPLPVLTYSIEFAKQIAEFDSIANELAEKFWPGQLTIILKLKDSKLKESMNLNEKIGVRIPDNKCALELLKKCKYLVGTSANISGKPSTNNPSECLKNLQEFDVFLDGGIIQSKGESTIVEIQNGEINVIREGALDKKEIEK